jgi:hypothetical protein
MQKLKSHHGICTTQEQCSKIFTDEYKFKVEHNLNLMLLNLVFSFTFQVHNLLDYHHLRYSLTLLLSALQYCKVS